MSALREDYEVLERRTLPPDPGLIKSLGMHHSLESAAADLVDNSIDAGAGRVLIRFETEAGRPVGLAVGDDGRGMNGEQADEAMRLGRQRKYESNAQGHFGIGLKAASFGHADTLTVCTSPRRGEYHGRRLRKIDVQRDYRCDVLDPRRIGREVDEYIGLLGAETGTVVRWTDTRFPKVTAHGTGDWLEDSKTRIRMHLGLIYHRLLAAGRVCIDIEVYDRTVQEAGAPEHVVSIDPFGFPASAVSGYPKTLIAHADQTELRLECHIVPPKSSGPAFRLYGRDGADFQGFYIYRNDRLLQVGGWNQVTINHRNRALARVVIDDFTSLSRHARMAPEKSGISLSPDLAAAIASAKADDGGGDAVSFEDYLGRAESVLAESKRRRRVRHPVADPSKGLHEDVRVAIRSETPVRKNEGPVEMRWRHLPPDKFIELDREDRVIYLNQRYRDMLTGGKTGLSDAPLLKTLVFLLTEEHFKGQYWGSRDKDFLDMWESILGTAVQTEYAYRMNANRG